MSPSLTPRQRTAAPRAPAATSKPVFEPADPMENMIQAAHKHLADSESQYSRPQSQQRWRRTNQEYNVQASIPQTQPAVANHKFEAKSLAGVEKLSDHMESFPLVPLAVIPKFVLKDLEKLESGLSELLSSLSSGESRGQLGEYATRELALVQRQLSQERAEQRVLQLLRGDLPVALGPIEQSTSLKNTSSAAAVPIFLTPQRSTSASPRGLTQCNRNAHASSVSLPGTSFSQSHGDRSTIASQHWTNKKTAVLMARKQVQAHATRRTPTASSVPVSGFIIASGDGGSKRRRCPRPIVKLSAEEEAKRRAHKVERERERRRQAAYQRLQARQELQAKRKQEQQRALKSQKWEESELKGAIGSSSQRQVENKDSESEDEGESDVSDVSNCSESDEANERAILALEIQVTPSPEEELNGHCSGSDSSTHDDATEDSGANCSGEKAFGSYQAEAEVFVECVKNELQVEMDLRDAAGPTMTSMSSRPETSIHSPLHSSTLKEMKIHLERTFEQDDCGEAEGLVSAAEIELVDEQRRNKQEQSIALELQRFMASRTAAMLEKLQMDKTARGYECASKDIISPRFSESVHHADILVRHQSPPKRTEALDGSGGGYNEAENSVKVLGEPEDSKHDDADGLETVDTAIPVVVAKNGELTKTQREDEIPSGINLHVRTNTVGLPRTPVVECKDYSSYFSNFHCILTSVFEQNHRTANMSGTTSSSSLYHRPVGAGGEHTMHLQLKLYQSWQSIMEDYATVFGKRIATPEGMVPAAAEAPWTPHYRVNSTTRREVCEIVAGALDHLGGGWEEHPSGLGLKTTWNLLWTWSKPRVERQTLLVWQKVNHFQHAKALTRKDSLKKHIGKYLAAGGKLRQAYDIIPPTFLLPKEYVAFVQAFQARGEALRERGVGPSKNVWIMKPVALSRGRGISLVNDLSQVIYGEQVVVQEYIAAPRLLDGFKFDLRLYVLVTSFNPLEAFLYDEGFVRLCTRPYQDGDISNLFVHLTNSSIQKVNQDAIAGSDNPVANASAGNENSKRGANPTEADTKHVPLAEAGGTKTTLAYLWRRLKAEGVDVDKVKRSIEEVVLKALLCGEDHIPFQVNSFDLLGYDILLDAELRPWLIEINSSPSMARENDLDFQVKDAVLLDTLRVVDPLHFDRAKLAEVIARRQRDLENEKRRPHAHARHPREAEELATRQLNEDLTAILRGRVPRAYGELPESLGNYRRLCPHTTAYNQLLKLKRSCLRPTERRV